MHVLQYLAKHYYWHAKYLKGNNYDKAPFLLPNFKRI